MTARLEDRGDRLIVWNRAEKRGALTPEFYAAIREAVAKAADPRVRAVILTGQGEFFCAGGDLTVLVERSKLPEAERREKVEDLNATIRALRSAPVPVIAAVEGGATGAGLSLVLACDLIFAARDAQFTASYVRAGLVPDGGLTASLARAVPRQLAMEMCLFAQPVEAVRLAELGVVTEAVAAGDALEAALAAVDRLAKGPSAAQRVIRGLAAQAQEASFDIMLDAERDAMARAQGGDEAAEGIASFLEKRPANFR